MSDGLAASARRSRLRKWALVLSAGLLGLPAWVGMSPASGVQAPANTPDHLVGAYYFSGWWEHPEPAHYLERGVDWRPLYPEREPVTGWFDDRQEFVDQQIALAAGGGLDFFAFEYFTNQQDGAFVGARENNNNGLKFFRTSPNKGLMRFALLYVNGGKFGITEKEKWKHYVDKWVNEYFTDPQHLEIAGKPVFIILGAGVMPRQWGGAEGADRETQDANVRQRLSELRKEAAKAGFPGVLIGGGVTQPTTPLIDRLKGHGYDFFTGFGAGYGADEQLEGTCDIPPYPGPNPAAPAENRYEVLLSPIYGMPCRWEKFLSKDGSPESQIPYAPVVIQGYDRRPVGKAGPGLLEPYLVDKTPALFGQQLEAAKAFVDDNPGMRLPAGSTDGPRMVVIYAWNEIGEGGILIPNAGEGHAYLNKVKEVFK